jgi:hypothetical protein
VCSVCDDRCPVMTGAGRFCSDAGQWSGVTVWLLDLERMYWDGLLRRWFTSAIRRVTEARDVTSLAQSCTQ